jgi:phage terminase large subunit-like protein
MFIAAQAAEKRMVEEGKEPRWRTFHFSSMQNPYISKSALEEITQDMTSLAYRMEILAEDVTEVPGALWKRDTIEQTRILTAMRDSEWDMIVVGVDPSATSTGDEAGIITAAKKGSHGYTLADNSVQGSPAMWAGMAVKAYRDRKANKIVAESNNGGEMVAQVIHQVDPNVPVELVHASRGKATRAEPVSALFEKGGGHHCGYFPYLEDEMCLWQPGGPSPNRLDAMVWAMTGLGIVNQTEAEIDWVKVVGM